MSEVIHLLPDNIANQIAAGEVIQRPASVVKELIENAVDAGASHIELHIKDAGKTSIQVIDDGRGMTEGDARMSFERHATSKLQSADDLFKLSTKGFRGEALASIAAIAHVELETVFESAAVGTQIKMAGSKLENLEPIARSKGTAITVKNLFFNVPARRNFLKSDQVETKHIVEEFNRIPLTHPEIAFKFSHNGNVLQDLLSAKLRKRIVDLFGMNFNKKLVPIEEKTDIVTIKGFIGKPEFVRKKRGEQYFFVNNRFFKNSYLNHAVTQAFDNLIPPKTFPAYFIYFEVPPNSLDVNIHPTKTEVKFEDERNIYSILRSTIKLALGKYNIAPSIDFEHEPQFDLPNEERQKPVQPPSIQVDPDYNPFQKTSASRAPSATSPSSGALKPNREDWENYYDITEDQVAPETTNTTVPEEDTGGKKLQVHNKFALVQVKTGIMLIDLKRAKERILYDDLMEQFMLTPIASQQLMFPFEHNMQYAEKLEWENNKTSLKRLGFNWEWRDNTIILSGAPSFLEDEDIAQCLDAISEKVAHEEIDKGELAHELIRTLSEAANTRKLHQLQPEELNHIIDRLFQSEQHQFSPSGRRIMNTIALEELNNYLK